MDLVNRHVDYLQGTLNSSDLDPDPLVQFGHWLEAAFAANLIEPGGMTLSTVGPEGRPSSRVVLLRGYSPEGLVFYTNYNSRKGRELAQNPWACLGFWWPALERQIRVEGRVERVSPEQSDAYFASRPYESQLGSAASPQSEEIASRAVLEERMARLREQYPQGVPRPAHWGGFRLLPDRFEFWQGRKNRLHDRFVYTLEPDRSWRIARLAP
ncbi:pyridoxamine 5'-phosphate oxidase [Meiothermus granaticius]|uniref:Pyridoxine/pyridoxamine 5'-phosphate oxidase n=1 Tax=Meiothermus granaticius NBRC 107808 TaxID=1227551 RepID=A0A399FF79_9DEIN|nr:pyridoxamine 5'-phosphate oxidase [Meiothermus granaticius]RIH93902.1 Pyridoxine/pyridoxamine 5'-phosphate oxidase [Meiothermus granaticius NBRC 107808]GEM86398.1 pyridoxine/pyridoxamine 5'-phosphate oxidase [Meiothermus granaticius NBRC 107808]